MPHSTFFSTPPPISEARPLPPVNTSLSIRSSSDFPASLKSPKSPIKPSPALSPPRKHFLLTTRGHGRSKSASAAMSLPPTSIPSLAPPSPTSSNLRRRSREYSPPLLRSSSLPLVIPEGKQQPSLMMTPPTPTTPPMIHNLSGIPRSASPTRVYASSLSPAGIRSGYYPGSSFSPRAPSPPSYLVNEPMYPGSSASSSSSPSTPTSLRSRSPSISSLETIPDTPDAEQEAVEAELKEAMERKASGLENEDEDDSALSRRRRSMDFERGGSRWGAGDKRKRWSVCGGEKRGDLDLETIWEEVLNTAEANNNIIRRDDTEDEEDDEEDEEDDDEEEDEIEEANENDEDEDDQGRGNDEDGEDEDDEGIIRKEP